MRSLAKNSLYNILYQTTGLIFPLISSIYVSRILMEDGIGKVAYAQNIASYFASAAALDFHLRHPRDRKNWRGEECEEQGFF